MKKFTAEQIKTMEILRDKVGLEYLARDEKFGLHGYIGKPQKLEGIWDNNNGFRIGIKGDDFPQIVWEDLEPIEISQYIPSKDIPKTLPTHLGGNGNMAEMVNNLRQIFFWDKKKAEFLRQPHVSASYNEDFSVREVVLKSGYDQMFISYDGIYWKAYETRTVRVLTSEELHSFY